MKTAILLPGLDGSGVLFEKLAESLSGHLNCIVISYPEDSPLNYDALTDRVRSCIPDNDGFVIVAESFSGPIAYRLGLNPPPNLELIVYGAGFIDNPNKYLLSVRVLLPYVIKLSTYLPGMLFSLLMLGCVSKRSAGAIKKVVRKLPVATIKHRLMLLSSLTMPDIKSGVRAVYIRPRSDFLVTEAGYRSVAHCHGKVTRYDIAGTHFIFQSNTVQAADIILKESGCL